MKTRPGPFMRIRNMFNSQSNDQLSPSTSPAPLRKLYHKVVPEKKETLRFECQYCLETKKSTDFVQNVVLPYICQHHLGTSSTPVCKKCLQGWLGAQMDCKTLLQISCPECDKPWDPEDVRNLISREDRKKFDVLEEMATQVTLVPENLPEEVTTSFLLSNGARFCPWCKWPFIKDGGCEAMQCIKCSECFSIEYALILEDEKGNRASPVLEDPDMVF